nr:trypsin-like peptidase domain-containing protein [Rhodopirellula sp. SM50]
MSTKWLIGGAAVAFLLLLTSAVCFVLLRPTGEVESAVLVLNIPSDHRGGLIISIDDIDYPAMAQGPLEYQVAAGQHLIELRRPGFQPVTASFVLDENQRRDFSPVWHLIPADKTSVEVAVSDDGLDTGEPADSKDQAVSPVAERPNQKPRPNFDDWYQDLEKAKLEAKASDKDILIAFDGSDWCGWSIRLAEEVFFQHAFRDQVDEKFVVVLIDFPRRPENLGSVENPARNQRLAEHFGVQGFPTIVLTNADGQPYAFDGFREGGPDAYCRYLMEMQAVREELDRTFALIENSGNGDQKLFGVSRALDLLNKQGVLRFYGDRLADWTQIALDHDPKNREGVYEKVFYLRWLVYFQRLAEGNQEQVAFLSTALRRFKSQCQFKNPDNGAQLHLLAGISWLGVGRDHAPQASQCFQQGLACGPRDETLQVRLQSLSLIGQSSLAGTGFVVSRTGLIMTNNHVIEGPGQVRVRFQQMGSPLEVPAQVVARDPDADIALLRVDVPRSVRLKPVVLASSEIRRGEEVAAFGYPMGNNSMIFTRGGISGWTAQDMLLVDCLINPGNSGGPLCDLSGRVLGMVTAKSVNTRSVNSYGLAIPAARLREFLEANFVDEIPRSTSYSRRTKNWKLVNDQVSPGVVIILKKN